MATHDENYKKLMIEALRRDLERQANQSIKKPFKIMVFVKVKEIDDFCASGETHEIKLCLN
jgi:hypothetical protein